MPIGQENSTSLNVFADDLPVFGVQLLQPFTHRLAAAIEAVETSRQAFETRIQFNILLYHLWYGPSTLSHKIARATLG
jgi:hypothetical protein